MKETNLSLVQSLFIKELDSYYQKLLSSEMGDYSRSTMALLVNGKTQQYIDDEFLKYWFIKLLNAPRPISLFYLDRPNYEFFNFNPKTLGIFLINHINFLMVRGYIDMGYDLVTVAMENDCFFETDFLSKMYQYNIFSEDGDRHIEKNKKNMHKFLTDFLEAKQNEISEIKL